MEKKVLLSLKDLVVKFKVRGRELTAIRGVSLDIYENESIAIVGESGSGKSVLTKTFSGMLDSNGYIAEGSIILNDDELAKTNVFKTNALGTHKIKKINAELDNATHLFKGKDLYDQLVELAKTKPSKDDPSFAEFEAKYDDLKDKYTDKISDDLTRDEINRNKTLANQIFIASKNNKTPIKEILEQYTTAIKEGNPIPELEIQDNGYKARSTKTFLIGLITKVLNKDSKFEAGSNTYKEILNLKHEYKQHLELTDEERASFTDKIADLKYQFSEEYNLSLTYDTKKEKNKIQASHARLKEIKASITSLEKQEKELMKKHKADLKADKEYQTSYKTRLAELKAKYKEEIKAVISEHQEERNFHLAKEVYLTIGRYNYIQRMKLVILLVHALRKAMELGLNLEDTATLNKIFEPYSFRVRFLSEDETTIYGYCILDLAQVKYTKDWQQIRGSRVATIFQDPMTSLNPIITIGKQMTSIIMKHQHVSANEARLRAIDMMAKVGITNPAARFDDYPFQYSGGMRQRIVIAIALSCQPKILVCDEPTTALDVTIQAQILKLIKDLQKEFNYTIVFITHDLGVVANIADRVAVIYGGQIVEVGTADEVFFDPRHPYTWALLSSMPQLAERGSELYSIAGTPPSLYNKIVGDPFAPRNPYCLKIDTLKDSPMFKVSDTHYAKTWLLDPRAPKVEKPEIIKDIHSKLLKTFNI